MLISAVSVIDRAVFLRRWQHCIRRALIAFAIALIFFAGTALPRIAAAYTQWEWTAVQVETTPGTVSFQGPTTVFNTKEEALQALISPRPDKNAAFNTRLSILTRSLGATQASGYQIDYRFGAANGPKIMGTIGPWDTYWVIGVSNAPRFASEAEVLEWARTSVPTCNGFPNRVEELNTWATLGISSGTHTQRKNLRINRGGSGSLYCQPSQKTIHRTQQATCPYGYEHANVANNVSRLGECSNAMVAVVRGSSLECPSGVSATVGNPCNVATGDKSQSETDHVAPGVEFVRNYHSAIPSTDGSLGAGWSHNFSAKLLFSGTGTTPVVLVRSGGHQEIIENSASGYRSLSGSGTRLLQSGSDWVARFSDGSSETFNASGALQRRVDRSGLITTLHYSVDPITSRLRLSSVVGPFGHRLDLDYVYGERIHSLSDTEGNAIEYLYDLRGNLTRVLFSDASFKEYLYEDLRFPNHLTGIIDENNNRLSTYSYDSFGRVVTSTHADNAKRVDISYDPSSSAVTDAAGLQTVYTFASTSTTSRRVAGITRGGLPETFQLGTDTQRRVTRETDARGGVTTYAYNADHLISKTEAYGTPNARTTSYTYRSTLEDLPTLITEGTRRTSVSYDTNSGNVLSRTITDTATSQSRTWTYTYNTFGQVLTVDGPRIDVSDVTTYTYYSCTTGYQCGQVQTITDALNRATTYLTYNAHGQPLTIQDPNGVITTLTYDLRQRLTSRTVSSEVTSFTYWPTGLLKRTILPDGSYLDYTYDAAHRLTDISDAQGNRVHYTLDAMGNRTKEDVLDPSSALTNTRTRVFNTLNRLSQEIGAAGGAAVTTSFGYDNNGNQTAINAPLGRNTSQSYDVGWSRYHGRS